MVSKVGFEGGPQTSTTVSVLENLAPITGWSLLVLRILPTAGVTLVCDASHSTSHIYEIRTAETTIHTSTHPSSVTANI